MAQVEGTRRRLIRLLLAVGLWIGTAALFLPLRHHDFIPMDDPVNVSENMFLEDGLTLRGLRHAFTGVYVANWQPLTMLSYAFDYRLHGRAAGGYLVTNFLLHATTTLLLFLALERLTGALGRSAFVAAIFGIHPLHVESVAWVSERKDVLSGVFFAAILWAYAHQPPKGRLRRPQQIAIFGLLALGLLAKSMLVTVPFVLLLLDFWPLQRVPRERLQPLLRALGPLALEKLPLFALAAASSVVTYAVQKASGAVAPLERLPLAARLLNIAPAYVGYLERAFWPTGLAIYYPLTPADLSLLRAIAATAALGAATVGAYALRRRAPYLLVGWLWYVGMLVPVSGLVQVGGQSMADRYTYLPLIGVTLAIAWGAWDLAAPKRAAHVALGAVAALLIAALARASSFQIRTWRDGESVAERALAVTRNNPRAHSMLASAFGLQGRWSEARPQIEAAIALEPGLAVHHGLLGLILQREGRSSDAVAAYRDALRLDPSLTQARINLAKALLELGRADDALAELGRAAGGAADTDQPEIHAARARAFAMRGDAAGAAAESEAALRHVPDFASVHARLGIMLVQAGRPSEAESQLRRAIALGVDDPEVYAGLGDALQREGRTAEAAEQLRAAVRLRPAWVEPSNNLAWILATAPDPGLRRPEEAITLAEAAARGSNRKNANVLDTLAVAYEAAGRRADALAVTREALALARAQREDELSETLAKRVRSYEADLPADKR